MATGINLENILIHILLNKHILFFMFNLSLVCVKLSQNMNRICLDTFLKQLGTNEQEVFEMLGLVLETRTKLRIVDKSMLMYNEHGAFIINFWEQ